MNKEILDYYHSNSQTIICGFPGIGKTWARDNLGWEDLDAVYFAWKTPTEKNEDFPNNYIRRLSSTPDIVLLSSHKTVRDALCEHKIPFWVIYPQRQCKEEYFERFAARGSSENFLKILKKEWDNWLLGMEKEDRCVGRVILKPGQYLVNVFFGDNFSLDFNSDCCNK